MKTVFVVIVIAAAAFAGGYWTASHRLAPGTGQNKGSHVASATSHAPAGGLSAKRTAGKDYVPGTMPPFSPGRAKEWLLSLKAKLETGVFDEIIMVEMMQEFAQLDEAGAAEVAAALRDLLIEAEDANNSGDDDLNEAGTVAMALTVYRWAQWNPEAALKFVSALPEDGDRKELMMVAFNRMARKDPAAAEGNLVSMKATMKDNERDEAAEGILKAISADDPAAAFAFAARHPDCVDVSDCEQIAERLARRDPRQAAAMTAELAGGQIGSGPLARVVQTWAQKDLPAAEQWAREYSGPGRAGVLCSVLEQKVSTDLHGVMQEIPSLQPAEGEITPQGFTHLTRTVAGQLSESQPQQAAEWVATLRQGDSQNAAVEEVVENWARADSLAASQWIAGLPRGGMRDSAVEQLVEEIHEREPAAALEWATSIADGDSRHRALQDMMSSWRRRDPEAAARAAQQLSAADREALDPPPSPPPLLRPR